MARPKGRENYRPSKAAIKSYYQMLKSAAGKGDTQAAAALIQLHQDSPERSRAG